MTNIVIDDKRMKTALRTIGAKTKRETVELGLGWGYLRSLMAFEARHHFAVTRFAIWRSECPPQLKTP